MKVKLIVEGGAMKPGPAVAQQLGPLGINLGKVISDVNSATTDFKGMNVPVEIDVDPKTKSFTIKVFSPSVAELLKKELAAERGSGSPKIFKIGNLAIEQIIGIAKTKQSALLAKDLKGAVKLVIGTCVSLGILVENKAAKDVENDVASGVYDKEISSGKTDVSADKVKELQEFYAVVKDKQEKDKKAAEEAAAAAEAAKAAAATAATAPGATPAATPAAGKAAAPAKADAKKK